MSFVRHNLPAREPLSLWGEGKATLPEGFQKLFPLRYTTRNPFSPKLAVGIPAHRERVGDPMSFVGEEVDLKTFQHLERSQFAGDVRARRSGPIRGRE